MATARHTAGLCKRIINGNPVEKHHVIGVDPLAHDPTAAWQVLQKHVKVKNKHPMDGRQLIRPDHLRFVCISDTHGKLGEYRVPIPDGDVLLHAGDLTMSGSCRQLKEFNTLIGRYPHRHKVVIAGNHDLSLDDDLMASRHAYHQKMRLATETQEERLWNKHHVRHPKELLTNCIYLHDDMVEISGIRIYGSPWQPEYGTWGFQVARGEKLLEKWNLIPDCVDVLMTHGPPVGFGDKCHWNENAGCVDLLNTVQQRVRPSYHVFGHIHEGYGMFTDGVTTFINASTCARGYKPINAPIVFDLPLPSGHTKGEPLGWPLSTGLSSETDMNSHTENTPFMSTRL